jgi:hypothetical protein
MPLGEIRAICRRRCKLRVVSVASGTFAVRATSPLRPCSGRIRMFACEIASQTRKTYNVQVHDHWYDVCDSQPGNVGPLFQIAN